VGPQWQHEAITPTNPLRLQYIQDHADITEKKVLDVGCGAGLLSEAMAKVSADVTGIDLSQAAIQVAKQHAEKKRVLVNYQCIAIEDLAETQPASFDVITCLEMLEHVPDPAAIIKHCATLLKPAGKLFISTINRNLKSYLGAIVAAEYLLKLLPSGTHEYAKFIRPSELNAWATRAHLKLADIIGVTYRPLSSQFTLSKDVSINYMGYYEK
jgi:2-polyprenyl-6-hydroxyphenyl methylase / 3-demethylubiquinone-9 3-methyltransferase